MTKKRAVKKQEVFFIATRYKNKPLDVTFYTKSGKPVPEETVTKEKTERGLQHFTTFAV